MNVDDAIIEFAESRGMAADINGIRGTIRLGGKTFRSYASTLAFMRNYEASLHRMGIKSPELVARYV